MVFLLPSEARLVTVVKQRLVTVVKQRLVGSPGSQKPDQHLAPQPETRPISSQVIGGRHQPATMTSQPREPRVAIVALFGAIVEVAIVGGGLQ